jgi:hypothetical protein
MGYAHIDNLYKNQTILMFRECYALGIAGCGKRGWDEREWGGGQGRSHASNSGGANLS